MPRKRDGASAMYAALGRPPVGNPMKALLYGTDALVIALFEIVNDPLLPAEQRWRLISDCVAKLGMTHAKAAVQQRLAEIGARILPAEDEDAGEPVDEETAARFVRFKNGAGT
jgi:hypothetical protein